MYPCDMVKYYPLFDLTLKLEILHKLKIFEINTSYCTLFRDLLSLKTRATISRFTITINQHKLDIVDHTQERQRFY